MFSRAPPTLVRTMNARILVVDDDASISEMIGIVLRALSLIHI